MNYILGLVLATIALFIAMDHLNQGPEQYWDLVAFAIVWGGTFAVSVITFPWSRYKAIGRSFLKLLFTIRPKRRNFVELCLNMISQHKQGQSPQLMTTNKFHHQLLNEGFELIHLGIPAEKIQRILSERIHHYTQESDVISNAVRSLAKYPPAFGLTGTVFGLVELMKGVSQGMDPKLTGIKMAIALVATLYGLLVSNLIINPAGEHIKKIASDEEKMAELALQAILLASQQASLLEAQELMNSMVSTEERVDIISQSSLFEGAA